MNEITLQLVHAQRTRIDSARNMSDSHMYWKWEGEKVVAPLAMHILEVCTYGYAITYFEH